MRPHCRWQSPTFPAFPHRSQGWIKMDKLDTLLEAYQSNCYPPIVAALADDLRVTPDSIRRLGVGYVPAVPFKDKKTGEEVWNYQGWFSWPERDAAGKLTGIGLRNKDNGSIKLMVQGSSHNLIYELNPDYIEQQEQDAIDDGGWDYPSPCPVCKNVNETKWCAIASNGAVCFCHREAKGSIRTRHDGAHLHILDATLYKGNQKPSHPLIDNGGPVVVIEGASDLLAAMDLGYVGVGRPSATAKIEELCKLLKGRSVIVVGENDRKKDGRWPGKEGAEKTAVALAKAGCPSVMLVFPPAEVDEKGEPKKADLRSFYSGNAEVSRLSREQFDKYVAKEGLKVEAPKFDRAAVPAGDEFFFDADDEEALYIRTKAKGDIYDNVKISSKKYARLIRTRLLNETGSVAKKTEIDDIVNTHLGLAEASGKPYPTFRRVAWVDDRVYLDLADAERRVVIVTPDGWETVPDDGAVRFIRARKMLALPPPVEGGSLDQLRPFVNLPHERDWVLACAWLLSVFLPSNGDGGRPILYGHGEQGSAKSSSCRRLRDLIDPAGVKDTTIPDSEKRLLITARAKHVIAFDNVDDISPTMANALCRLSTGAGHEDRELYSDDDVASFSLSRSLILNGIVEDFAQRADLRDRIISVRFPPLQDKPSNKRLRPGYEAARPGALGALLDAVSMGLRRLPSLVYQSPSRLADFCEWVTACEPAMPWKPGAFAAAFAADRADAVASAIENSAVAAFVVQEVKAKGKWEGYPCELLTALHRPGNGSERWDIPKTVIGLGGAINRALPALAANGITHFKIHKEHGSLHTFKRVAIG